MNHDDDDNSKLFKKILFHAKLGVLNRNMGFSGHHHQHTKLGFTGGMPFVSANQQH